MLLSALLEKCFLWKNPFRWRQSVVLTDVCKKVFSMDGRFLRKFGDCQMHVPDGICFDNHGQLYVCGKHRMLCALTVRADRERHCVVVFSADGRVITRFSHPFDKRLGFPSGLKISRLGHVLLTHPPSNRAMIFAWKMREGVPSGVDVSPLAATTAPAPSAKSSAQPDEKKAAVTSAGRA